MSGTVLQRSAKLNLDRVRKADPANPHCPVQQSGEQLWQHYAGEFDDATSSDDKWAVYTSYAAHVLKHNGLIGRKAYVSGALCQNFKLSIAVHCRMRVGVVLPHIYFFFVPSFGHCENWISDFIEMNMALATPALFAIPNRSCSEGLKWQNWSHLQFAKSLHMTCLI